MLCVSFRLLQLQRTAMLQPFFGECHYAASVASDSQASTKHTSEVAGTKVVPAKKEGDDM